MLWGTLLTCKLFKQSPKSNLCDLLQLLIYIFLSHSSPKSLEVPTVGQLNMCSGYTCLWCFTKLMYLQKEVKNLKSQKRFRITWLSRTWLGPNYICFQADQVKMKTMKLLQFTPHHFCLFLIFLLHCSAFVWQINDGSLGWYNVWHFYKWWNE